MSGHPSPWFRRLYHRFFDLTPLWCVLLSVGFILIGLALSETSGV